MLAHSANEPDQAVEADANAELILAAVNERDTLASQLAQAQQEIYETPPSADHPTGTKWKDVAGWNGFACTENQKLIATLQEQLAQAQGEALRLAECIWRTEYAKTAPNWRPCLDAPGIISQIDNMFAGVREQRDAARAECERLRAIDRINGEAVNGYRDEIAALKFSFNRLRAENAEQRKLLTRALLIIDDRRWPNESEDIRAALAKHQPST
jgi:hypothetical protein